MGKKRTRSERDSGQEIPNEPAAIDQEAESWLSKVPDDLKSRDDEQIILMGTIKEGDGHDDALPQSYAEKDPWEYHDSLTLLLNAPPSETVVYEDDSLTLLLDTLQDGDSSLRKDSPEQEPVAEEKPIEIDLNATASDVAKSMLAQFEVSGELPHSNAVWHIRRHFGERFLGVNRNGNDAIMKEVLHEFRKISPDVVWSQSSRTWRYRTAGEAHRRRRVE